MPAKKKPKKPALKKPAKKAAKKAAPKKPAKKAAPKKPAKKAAPKKPAKAPVKAPVKAKPAKPARHNSKPAQRSDVPGSNVTPVETAKPKTPVAWSQAVRAHVANAGAGFAGQLRKLAGATSWSHADSPELMGLEKWGRALTALDRRAGVRALIAAAQYGFPKALAAGGDALNDLGFTGKDADPITDGGAVEVQILRAARWLDDATDANAESLRKSYDRTRQLHVWEEDLHPAEAECFYWYLEVGQCACAAILNDEKPGTEESYYGWSPSTCVARGLVIAARGLRAPGSDIDVVLEGLGAAIAASFT